MVSTLLMLIPPALGLLFLASLCVAGQTMITTQQVAAAVSSAASGDNLGAHMTVATGLGGWIAGVAVWGLQCAHLSPPAYIVLSIGGISTWLASVLMRRFGN